MIELTEYAKAILRNNPERVKALQDRQAINRAIGSCGLTVISIQEMNVLLNMNLEVRHDREV